MYYIQITKVEITSKFLAHTFNHFFQQIIYQVLQWIILIHFLFVAKPVVALWLTCLEKQLYENSIKMMFALLYNCNWIFNFYIRIDL